MDQSTTLQDALRGMHDRRQARGKHHNWARILATIASALACGHRSGRASAHWSRERRSLLLRRFQPARGRLPSESTLRTLDITALERARARSTQHLDQPRSGAIGLQAGTVLHGQVIDGKQPRGAGAHGRPIHLVALVRSGVS